MHVESGVVAYKTAFNDTLTYNALEASGICFASIYKRPEIKRKRNEYKNTFITAHVFNVSKLSSFSPLYNENGHTLNVEIWCTN